MRILLVNDDGYRAPGLRTLGHAMQQAGHQVIVAAPDRERSAASLSPVFLGRPRYEKHVSPYGVEHFYLTDGEPVPMEDAECDFLLCQAGWATLTPITWNMVAQGGMHAPEVTL